MATGPLGYHEKSKNAAKDQKFKNTRFYSISIDFPYNLTALFGVSRWGHGLPWSRLVLWTGQDVPEIEVN